METAFNETQITCTDHVFNVTEHVYNLITRNVNNGHTQSTILHVHLLDKNSRNVLLPGHFVVNGRRHHVPAYSDGFLLIIFIE